MDSAYAAGIASRSTSSVDTRLAVAELISGGSGLAPLLAPKNSAYPCRVSGAAIDGGLVAASVSLCSDVSTIHATGTKNRTPTIQANNAYRAPARPDSALRRRVLTGAV